MDFLTLGVPWPIVLVTCISLLYLLIRKDRQARAAKTEQSDVVLAQAIIGELEGMWHQVRRNLAAHQATVLRFKERVDDLRKGNSGSELQELSNEAASVLQPTQRFNDEICSAYDKIRQQADILSNLGSKACRGKQWQLGECTYDDIGALLFPQNKPISTPLCVAVFGTRANADENEMDRTRHVERVLKLCMRKEDIIVNYGETEFAIFMPGIVIAEACKQAIRIQTVVEESLPLTFDGGVAETGEKEDLASVMSRVDAALYSARTSPDGCVYQHSGSQIRLATPKHDKSHRGKRSVRAPIGQPLRMTTKKII